MDSQGTSISEHYNLRWNNYSTNLIQVFSEHQHHETLVDVTLTCEGQFVKAHKLILSACSGFFQDMFKIHTLVQHPFIVLNGIKFSHLKHILEFIYHGEVKILDEDLEAVLSLGETFQIKGLSSVKIKRQTLAPAQAQPKTTSAPSSTVPIDAPNIKIKYQTPVPAPISTVPTDAPNVLTNQQKENIRDAPRNAKKPKEALGKTMKKGNAECAQNGSEQNGKEQMEPALKKTKLPEAATTRSSPTSSKVESRVDEAPKKDAKADEKIPRPANAFMIFANEWRKKLSVEHPEENNKGISVLLGNMWKSLSAENKEMYYLAASKARTEHELKYPGYVYNPNEARRRKTAVRRKTIDCSSQEPQGGHGVEIIEIEDEAKDSSGTSSQSQP